MKTTNYSTEVVKLIKQLISPQQKQQERPQSVLSSQRKKKKAPSSKFHRQFLETAASTIDDVIYDRVSVTTMASHRFRSLSTQRRFLTFEPLDDLTQNQEHLIQTDKYIKQALQEAKNNQIIYNDQWSKYALIQKYQKIQYQGQLQMDDAIKDMDFIFSKKPNPR
ncbi:hypothetical protein pb186bvf_012319 [Paramecium bursaria]